MIKPFLLDCSGTGLTPNYIYLSIYIPQPVSIRTVQTAKIYKIHNIPYHREQKANKQTNKQNKHNPTVHFFLLRHRAVSKSHRSLFPLPVVVHWHEKVLQKALAAPAKKLKNPPLAQGPPSNPARLRVEVPQPRCAGPENWKKTTTLLSQTAGGSYGHSQIDIKLS